MKHSRKEIKDMVDSLPMNNLGRVYSMEQKRMIVSYINAVPKKMMALKYIGVSGTVYYYWKHLFKTGNMADRGTLIRSVPKPISAITKRISELKEELDKLMQLQTLAKDLGVNL